MRNRQDHLRNLMKWDKKLKGVLANEKTSYLMALICWEFFQDILEEQAHAIPEEYIDQLGILIESYIEKQLPEAKRRYKEWFTNP